MQLWILWSSSPCMRTAHKPIYYNDPASAVVLKWDSDTHNVWGFFFSDKNFILTWTKYILFRFILLILHNLYICWMIITLRVFGDMYKMILIELFQYIINFMLIFSKLFSIVVGTFIRTHHLLSALNNCENKC